MIKKHLIVRPLNRVKIAIWPRFKLGLIDIMVFIVYVATIFSLIFIYVNNAWLRIGLAAGVGLLGGIILLIGEPNRRLYNKIWLIIGFLCSKKRFIKFY